MILLALQMFTTIGVMMNFMTYNQRNVENEIVLGAGIMTGNRHARHHQASQFAVRDFIERLAREEVYRSSDFAYAWSIIQLGRTQID